MNEQLAILVRVQELDSRLEVLAEKRRQFPELVEAAAKPVTDAQAEVMSEHGELEALNKQRRQKDLDLKEREERIEKLRARSIELKTNKEYQTHLFEIELAQQEKGTAEERLLELMERIELLQKEVGAAEARLAARRKEYDVERGRMQTEQHAMDAEAERLAADHAEAISQLAPANRRSYEYLKATRKGLAVVALKNGACQGCRLSLPPQLVAESRKNEKILTCTYCHRILYSPPPVVETLKA